MAACEVRRLDPSDLPLLRELNALFAEVFGERDTYLGNAPDDDYCRSILADPNIILLVALAEGRVVGGLGGYRLRKFEQPRSEIYIYDLAVAESHRRQGLATALIETLQDIAAARGAWVIFVQADHGDDPAVALYTKLGTREDVMHFDIPVPRPR